MERIIEMYSGQGRKSMFNLSRPIGVGVGFLAFLLAIGGVEASFWSRFKSSAGQEKNSVSSQDLNVLPYREHGGASFEQAALWTIDLGQPISKQSWVGSTYKSIPYSELEFNQIRKKKVEEEFQRLRTEYINKKKAEINKNSEAVVENLLDDLLGGDTKKEKEEDVEIYLEGFDEDVVRRRVASRTFVSQDRAVLVPCLYVETQRGELYCLELETGLTVWVLGLSAPLVGVPFESEKYLYIVDASVCRVVDKRSGYVTEKIDFRRAIHHRVYGQGDRVFAYSYDRSLLCYEWGGRFAKWSLRVNAAALSGVFGHDNGVMLPMDDGKFYSVSFDGSIQWNFVSKAHSDEKIYLEKLRERHAKELEREQGLARKEGRPEEKEFIRKHSKAIDEINQKIVNLEFRARGRYVAPSVISGEDLFVGSTDYQFYKLSRFSGLPEWSYSSGGELKMRPECSVDEAWVVTESGALHRVDRKMGKGVAVVASGVARLLGVRDGVAIYQSNDGVVHFYFEGGAAHIDRQWNKGIGIVVSAKDKLLVQSIRSSGVITGFSMNRFKGFR